MHQRLFSTGAAAQQLGLSPRTLEKWRLTGEGPPYLKLSPHAVRYRMSDIEAWLGQRQRTSTSDPGPEGR